MYISLVCIMSAVFLQKIIFSDYFDIINKAYTYEMPLIRWQLNYITFFVI